MLKYVPMVESATLQIKVGRLSLAYRELDVTILREDLDMFRQWLAWLIPKRRPFRLWANQASEALTHEPPCDTALAEVYHAHGAIHGANQLLPADALPDPPEHPQESIA